MKVVFACLNVAAASWIASHARLCREWVWVRCASGRMQRCSPRRRMSKKASVEMSLVREAEDPQMQAELLQDNLLTRQVRELRSNLRSIAAELQPASKAGLKLPRRANNTSRLRARAEVRECGENWGGISERGSSSSWKALARLPVQRRQGPGCRCPRNIKKLASSC